MATKKEIRDLYKLQNACLEYEKDGSFTFAKQEFSTYLDGVADSIRIIRKFKTVEEILNLK